MVKTLAWNLKVWKQVQIMRYKLIPKNTPTAKYPGSFLTVESLSQSLHCNREKHCCKLLISSVNLFKKFWLRTFPFKRKFWAITRRHVKFSNLPNKSFWKRVEQVAKRNGLHLKKRLKKSINFSSIKQTLMGCFFFSGGKQRHNLVICLGKLISSNDHRVCTWGQIW